MSIFLLRPLPSSVAYLCVNPQWGHLTEVSACRIAYGFSESETTRGTLKKPNTHRKYDAVLTRFAKVFDQRILGSISTEGLNDYVVELMKSGMSANTVLHNVVDRKSTRLNSSHLG